VRTTTTMPSNACAWGWLVGVSSATCSPRRDRSVPAATRDETQRPTGPTFRPKGSRPGSARWHRKTAQVWPARCRRLIFPARSVATSRPSRRPVRKSGASSTSRPRQSLSGSVTSCSQTREKSIRSNWISGTRKRFRKLWPTTISSIWPSTTFTWRPSLPRNDPSTPQGYRTGTSRNLPSGAPGRRFVDQRERSWRCANCSAIPRHTPSRTPISPTG
jgi:hypothetical protein